MRNLLCIFVASLFIGCADGGDSTGGGGLPDGSSVTCGDFVVDASSPAPESEPSESVEEGEDDVSVGIINPAVSKAVSAVIDDIEKAGGYVEDIKFSKESVIVVGCGGTIISNETNVTNDVSGSGTED